MFVLLVPPNGTESYCNCHGYKHVKLTRATGGWTIEDGSVTVTNRRAETAHQGEGCLGGSIWSKSMPSTSWSFNHLVPSDLPALDTRLELNLIGNVMSSRVNKGGNSWDLELFNTLTTVY